MNFIQTRSNRIIDPGADFGTQKQMHAAYFPIKMGKQNCTKQIFIFLQHVI